MPLHPPASEQAAETRAATATRRRARGAIKERSMHIVASFERAPGGRVLIAEVALSRAVGKRARECTALGLDVRDELPDECGRDRSSPCGHSFRASLEDRLVDVCWRSAVPPVCVGEI